MTLVSFLATAGYSGVFRSIPSADLDTGLGRPKARTTAVEKLYFA